MAGAPSPEQGRRLSSLGSLALFECEELPPPEKLRKAVRQARPRQVLSVEPVSNVNWLRQLVIALIHLYQRHLSVRLTRRCVLEPSCSRYAELAIAQNGLRRGFIETWHRLHRCMPENEGRIDYPKGVKICPTKSSQLDVSSMTSHAPN